MLEHRPAMEIIAVGNHLRSRLPCTQHRKNERHLHGKLEPVTVENEEVFFFINMGEWIN